jgi:hypothetical protein
MTDDRSEATASGRLRPPGLRRCPLSRNAFSRLTLLLAVRKTYSSLERDFLGAVGVLMQLARGWITAPPGVTGGEWLGQAS